MAKQYFCENSTINEDTLSAFLDKYLWKFYDIYDKDCKREDIMFELEEQERTATEDEIDAILDKYENTMSDEDIWHYHLQNAIDWVIGDYNEDGEE